MNKINGRKKIKMKRIIKHFIKKQTTLYKLFFRQKINLQGQFLTQDIIKMPSTERLILISKEIWQESAEEEMKQHSQKFAVFFNDDNESQSNQFKRKLDERVEKVEQQFQKQLKCLMETIEPMYAQKNFYLNKIDLDFQKDEVRTEVDGQAKKQPKSCVYSKNYREKKKQRMKILEEQNSYLKKKVDQLQLRLRQKQMQINRLKFTSTQQFQLRTLNQQIMNKLKLISVSTQSQPESENKNQIKKQLLSKVDEAKMHQFVKIFDTYGMGGTQAKQMLQYYINQFIENVMRDGQKYHLLNWINKRYRIQEKTKIELQLQEEFPQTQQEKKQMMGLAIKVMPLTLELLNSCREIYRVYKKAMGSLERIHELIKAQLPHNISHTQKRMKMIIWFQNNRYRKQLREIRAKWMDLVKSQDQPWLSSEQISIKKKMVK